MGASTALFLARAGAKVVLVDRTERPFEGASRWNEGKIHLGFLYAGDGSGRTAARLLTGGLRFGPLTEELIGVPIAGVVTDHPDTYLLHRDSVVAPDAFAAYAQGVMAAAASHPDAGSYLGALGPDAVVQLSPSELAASYEPSEIRAAFRVPERSVRTNWIADRFVDALNAEPRIEQMMGSEVLGVRDDGVRLTVETSSGQIGPFDIVVNALWSGRLAIDAQRGDALPTQWSHRYRVSLFATLRRDISLSSAVVATGPFGDVKNYNGAEVYLSWYPTGLRAEGSAIAPPEIVPRSEGADATIMQEMIDRLAAIIPGVKDIRAAASSMRLQGGWVFAAGAGSLANPQSTIHRRDRLGITRRGAYVSVDTGKYSTAPWLAKCIAENILG